MSAWRLGVTCLRALTSWLMQRRPEPWAPGVCRSIQVPACLAVLVFFGVFYSSFLAWDSVVTVLGLNYESQLAFGTLGRFPLGAMKHGLFREC